MSDFSPKRQTIKLLARKVAGRTLSILPARIYKAGFRALELLLPIYLNRLRHSKQPVIVGPWTSEIGHELLYWIPFLENLRNKGFLDPDRTFVISRGGNSSWYRNIANHYYNAFQDISPEEYKQAVTSGRAGNLEKRLVVDRFDRTVLKNGLRHFGHDRYFLLHPMIMNQLLIPIWRGRLPVELEAKYLSFCHFRDEDVDLSREGFVLNNSEEYVAVKFYFNKNFHCSEANITFVNNLISYLSRRHKVLAFHWNEMADNHSQPSLAENKNVISCIHVPFAKNLHIQTALLRKAKYLVSTFGGFGILPAFLNKKSYIFYSGTFDNQHLELCFRLFNKLSPGGLIINDTSNFSPSRLLS